MKRCRAFTIDIETTGLDPLRDRITSIGIKTREGKWLFPFIEAGGRLVPFPFYETLEILEEVFKCPDYEARFHNAKFDLGFFTFNGIAFECAIRCTMLGEWYFDERKKLQHLSLAASVKEKYGEILKPYRGYVVESGDLFVDQGEPLEVKALQDVEWTDRLYEEKQLPAFAKDPQLFKSYTKIHCEVIRVIVEMELSGFRIDREACAIIRKEFQKELREIEEALRKLSGYPINIGSTEQLTRYLFGPKVGLKPKRVMLEKPELYQLKKRGPNGETLWSTREEVLQEYEGEHPAVDLILRYREIEKLRGTYIDPFDALAARDSEERIRTHYHFYSKTGRLTSSDPFNGQNLPRKQGVVRKVVIAANGCKLIVADYSQLELRLMAHFSQDPEMLKAYRLGLDIHQMTQDALGIDQRVAAKNVNFGLIYGLSAGGLKLTLWQKAKLRYDWETCNEWRDNFLYKKYVGIPRYLDAVDSQIRGYGFVRSIAGRYRRVTDLLEEDWKHPGQAHREAVNFTIQGSAADLMLIAMRNLRREILKRRATDARWNRVRQLVQVHDSLVVEAPDELAEEALALVKSCMESAATLRVPLVAAGGIGRSWEDAESDAKGREAYSKMLFLKDKPGEFAAALKGALKDCKGTRWLVSLNELIESIKGKAASA